MESKVENILPGYKSHLHHELAEFWLYFLKESQLKKLCVFICEDFVLYQNFQGYFCLQNFVSEKYFLSTYVACPLLFIS